MEQGKVYDVVVKPYKPHWWSRTRYEIHVPELGGCTQVDRAFDIRFTAQEYIAVLVTNDCFTEWVPKVRIRWED